MDKKKMCWVSWKNLTKSKGEGGLGFRDLQSFNEALLAKLSWRILNKPDCLLARILLGKYCYKTPFLDSKPPSNTSHGWRGICIGKELLKSQLGRLIGNGETTSLWKDPWLSLRTPQRPMGPAPLNSHDLKVSALISHDSCEWDREKIRKILPEWEEEILAIKLSGFGASDTHAWLPAKTGLYTAKSGYYEAVKDKKETALSQFQEANKDFNWTKEIWNIRTSPKTKFFLWKVMRGALPLGENLRARNINNTARCTFCGEDETTLHLFFQCSFAKEVWRQAPFKHSVAVDRITSFRSGLEASKLMICLPPSGVNNGPLLPWIVWSIWLARNQKIFNERTISPVDTIVSAISLAREWQGAQEIKPGKETKRTTCPNQNRDVEETYFCKTDAAWSENQKAAGFGWILAPRSTGPWLKNSSADLHIASPLMAKAIAILLAIKHARSIGVTILTLASDSKQVIEAIKSEQPPKELHGILHDILFLSSSFINVSFTFISRVENHEADHLAKLSLRSLFVCETE